MSSNILETINIPDEFLSADIKIKDDDEFLLNIKCEMFVCPYRKNIKSKFYDGMIVKFIIKYGNEKKIIYYDPLTKLFSKENGFENIKHKGIELYIIMPEKYGSKTKKAKKILQATPFLEWKNKEILDEGIPISVKYFFEYFLKKYFI